MSGIFGALQLSDNDRSYVNTIGQRVVYDAVKRLIDQHNEDVRLAYGVFVGESTSDFKRRYKLPGGGYLQKRAPNGKPGLVKAYGEWDIALPLEDFGAGIGGNDVAIAYMTIQELDRHIDTVTMQNLNTIRREILVALLNNDNYSFVDPINGTLTCVPLANGDAVIYPPAAGSDTEGTDNHYLESGYAYTAISDTNNPFKTIHEELVQHNGGTTGGESVAVFINPDETPYVEALTDFDPVNDRFVVPGANIDQVVGLPANLPGRVIGRCNSCWVVEWRWTPSHYMIGLELDPSTPRPLIERIDPVDTGLGSGLQLVAVDEKYPFTEAFYRNRFGFGVGNRLNGVVMELGTGGSYTIPTAYDR